MLLLSGLTIIGLLRLCESTARELAEIRIMRLLANDPFVPYEKLVSLTGPEVDLEELGEVHASLMRIVAVPEGAAETVPRHNIPGVESYIKRGPLRVPHPYLIRTYFLSEANIRASRHGLPVRDEPVLDPVIDASLSLPDGWDDPSKAGIFLTMTPEIFVLHALSQDMYATDSAIENLAQRAVFFLVSVEEISAVRERELAATVLPTETVRILEIMYHRGIRATTDPAFAADLPPELRNADSLRLLGAWMRFVIIPALQDGLQSITSLHESFVCMPEAAAKQFFATSLREITGNFIAFHYLARERRQAAFIAILHKLGETVPQPSDAAVIAHMDSLGFHLRAQDIIRIREHFEQITLLPAAVVAGIRHNQSLEDLRALFPAGWRLQNLRSLHVIVDIWKRVCLNLGLCVDRGYIWELSLEGAQRAFFALRPPRTASEKPFKRAKHD